MSTALRERDPRTADRLLEMAGKGLDLACDGNNGRLARTIGADKADASRWRRGQRNGRHARFFADVYNLAANEKTNPWALLAEAHAAAESGMMALSDEALVRRFAELMRHEAEREGTENGLSQTFALTGDLASLADALIAEAGVEMELAAVCRELDRRGLDPRRPL